MDNTAELFSKWQRWIRNDLLRQFQDLRESKGVGSRSWRERKGVRSRSWTCGEKTAKSVPDPFCSL
jgi:hypothetical protein